MKRGSLVHPKNGAHYTTCNRLEVVSSALAVQHGRPFIRSCNCTFPEFFCSDHSILVEGICLCDEGDSYIQHEGFLKNKETNAEPHNNAQIDAFHAPVMLQTPNTNAHALIARKSYLLCLERDTQETQPSLVATNPIRIQPVNAIQKSSRNRASDLL